MLVVVDGEALSVGEAAGIAVVVVPRRVVAAVVVEDAVVVLLRLDGDADLVERLVARVGDAVGAGGEVGAGAVVRVVGEAVLVVIRVGATVQVLEVVEVLGDVGALVADGPAGVVAGRLEVRDRAASAGGRYGGEPGVADAVRVVIVVGAAVGVLEAVEVFGEDATGIAGVGDAVVVIVRIGGVWSTVAVAVDGEEGGQLGSVSGGVRVGSDEVVANQRAPLCKT